MPLYPDIMRPMVKKKHKQPNPGRVIIPGGHPNPPDSFELDVACILVDHYRCDVVFIIPTYDYKRKTADIMMNGVEWEIKCPTGASKSTIGNQLRWGSKQSKSIVMDSRHTSLDYEEIEKRVKYEVLSKSSIKRVILINKTGKIVEIRK